jgi:hypothetical protein
MSDQEAPASWLVQVTFLAPLAPTAEGDQWRGAIAWGAPSFKNFNVAVANATKAIEATTRHLADAEKLETRIVRGLSPEDIATPGLRPEEVRPA